MVLELLWVFLLAQLSGFCMLAHLAGRFFQDDVALWYCLAHQFPRALSPLTRARALSPLTRARAHTRTQVSRHADALWAMEAELAAAFSAAISPFASSSSNSSCRACVERSRRSRPRLAR